MKLSDILDYRAFRFIAVGLISNSVLFIAYLALTEFGLGSKTAMTILYLTGVLQGFIFNKKWTFSHDGKVLKTFTAYIFLYTIGYIINLLCLFIFVDWLGFRHQWVQGGIIVLMSSFFFLIQRFLIFKQEDQVKSRMS